ncbi:hypothetical protein [Vibrio sp. SCSIO 43136]|nr:hypothetical protein [Vibrio sp. SCSIO 43136]USD64928.1 hypothetical protein J4N39_12730 [Vibrio sp. SCSIO 43136]
MQKLLLPLIIALLAASLSLQGVMAAMLQLLAFVACCYLVLTRKQQPTE